METNIKRPHQERATRTIPSTPVPRPSPQPTNQPPTNQPPTNQPPTPPPTYGSASIKKRPSLRSTPKLRRTGAYYPSSQFTVHPKNKKK